MTDTLLQTKLYIPPTRPSLVHRASLIEKLNQWVNSKLTLVSAPAGFGKTTLIVDWLSHEKRPSTWVSLDEDDNELHTFFSYLNAAIRPFAGVGMTLSRLLQASQPVSSKAFPSALINDVTTVTHPFILVLDDYHVISQPDIHQAVSFLLDHMPAQMHLVITSRVDPLLPLPRLRASGQMGELRTDDLRFQDRETVIFLQQTMGLTLEPSLVAPLANRIEGWVAGLQIAALSLQQFETETQIQHFVSDFTASHRYIFDYLTDEVLQQRPSETQDFLLQTSILDRFNADVCTAVTDQKNSQAILQTLERANLFLFPLDENRRWYRYHHLFADLLRQRLQRQQPELIPELYQRASQWFAARGEIETAVNYALTGGNLEEAAQLLDEAALGFISRSEIAKLLNLARRLPIDVQAQYPRLCLAQGWAYVFARELDKAEAYAQRAEIGLTMPSTLSDEFPAKLAQAHLVTIRAYIATRKGNYSQATIFSERALALMDELPQELAGRLHGSILINLGQTQMRLDEIESAEASFRQAIEYCKANGRTSGVMASYSNMMVLQRRRGQLNTAKAAGLQGLAWLNSVRHRDDQIIPAEGEVQRELGIIFYEQNELDAARDHLEKGLELYRFTSLASFGHRLHYLFFVAVASGDLVTAVDIHQQIEPLLNDLPPNVFRIHVAKRSARIGRLSRLQPDVAQWPEALRQWLTTIDSKEAEITYIGQETEALHNKAAILVALNQWEASLSILNQIAESSQAARRFGDMIFCRVQQAIVLNHLSQPETAVDYLSEAVTLAEEGHYLRVFLDESEALLPLLSQLPAAPYRDFLLDQIEQGNPSVATPSIIPSALLEPLSGREVEVLVKLATHLSGPEIAEQLHISPNTLKTHTKNIYSKLGVNGRNEAVVKAQISGLL